MNELAAKLRVMVVDDHPLFRRGVTSVVNAERDMCVVAEASDGRTAALKFDEILPDIVLIDIKMPGLDGVGAIKQIRALHPSSRFLVLTTYGGDVAVRRALDAGAAGYVLKNAVVECLPDAVRTVSSGRPFVPPEVAAELARHALDSPLTPREIEVLAQVGTGRTNAAMARHLRVSEETVKSHMSHILSKLHARDRTHALAIAIERGIVDPG